MKRLLTLFFSFCLIFNSSIITEAKSPDVLSSTHTEYINDNLYAEVEVSIIKKNNIETFSDENPHFLSRATTKQKTVSKTCTLKNNAGATVATYKLTGTFTYNGSSSTCTNATYSTSVTNSAYSFTSKSAKRSANTAIGTFTLSSSIQKISKTLTIKCSANGTIQ